MYELHVVNIKDRINLETWQPIQAEQSMLLAFGVSTAPEESSRSIAGAIGLPSERTPARRSRT
jgi:hypothetical protein